MTGIVAYRRVSAVGRRLSASLNLGTTSPTATGRTSGTSLRARTGAGQQKPLFSVRRTGRTAIRATRETYCFTRDVREGMELYMARHSAPAGSTLRTDKSLETARHDDEKDGH